MEAVKHRLSFKFCLVLRAEQTDDHKICLGSVEALRTFMEIGLSSFR